MVLVPAPDHLRRQALRHGLPQHPFQVAVAGAQGDWHPGLELNQVAVGEWRPRLDAIQRGDPVVALQPGGDVGGGERTQGFPGLVPLEAASDGSSVAAVTLPQPGLSGEFAANEAGV